MSITSNQPMSESAPPPQPSPLPRWIYLVFLILLGGIGYLAYAGYSARTQLNAELTKASEQSAQLSARLGQANDRIAELRGELEVTSRHVNLTQAEVAQAHSLAQKLQEEQRTSDARLTAQIGQVKSESEQKIGQVSTEVTGAKGDIEATKKDLEATKAKLGSAVGDLTNQGSLIARNHEELDALRKLGERNIFDFTLQKTKSPQKVGPIALQLTKVDTKHYRYNVIVVADDKQIEKKDKTVDDLVQFYVHGARAPYELVVFEVGKDRITGYLSTPKDTTAAAPPPKPTT
jgi:predicted  nucleic acid-binding Zn-ribbon protein